MRTTLTIEPAVATRLRKLLRDEGRTLKGVVNEALREGLSVMEGEKKPVRRKFKVEAHDFGLKAGIDPDRISQFAEQLEDKAFAERFRKQ